MGLPKRQALSSGFNGGNDGSSATRAILETILDTAMKPPTVRPHTYISWALDTLGKNTENPEILPSKEHAHFELLRAQTAEFGKTEWRQEHVDELDTLMISANDPDSLFQYPHETLPLEQHVSMGDFRNALESFLSYQGLKNFAEFRESIQVKQRATVTALPVERDDNIKIFVPPGYEGDT